MSPKPKRVAVICDSPLLRRGLAQVINAAPDLQMVAAAKIVGDGYPEVVGSDVILLDLHVPARETAELVTRLNQRGHAVILLSASETQTDVDLALQVGARGYLSRQVEERELLTAIRAVASGRSYVSTSLADPPSAPRITERERQILELVASGATDREIAAELKISEHTVHSHLDRLRDKTGSRRRADLTRLALEQGITREL